MPLASTAGESDPAQSTRANVTLRGSEQGLRVVPAAITSAERDGCGATAGGHDPVFVNCGRGWQNGDAQTWLKAGDYQYEEDYKFRLSKKKKTVTSVRASKVMIAGGGFLQFAEPRMSVYASGRYDYAAKHDGYYRYSTATYTITVAAPFVQAAADELKTGVSTFSPDAGRDTYSARLRITWRFWCHADDWYTWQAYADALPMPAQDRHRRPGRRHGGERPSTMSA